MLQQHPSDGVSEKGDAAMVSSSKSASLEQSKPKVSVKDIWSGLSWLDRLLPLLIISSMIIGVVLGGFVPNIKPALTEQVELYNVSAPLAIGLIVMMWPILTKVQFEKLPWLLSTRRLWVQIGFSIVLNWIVGPFLMLGLAWATLPERDMAPYRTGVLLVGIARCIAMVMIWVSIAKGDCDICACIVIINSILQMVLYAPMALFFINVVSDGDELTLSYGSTAISVLIYLGIPLVAGVITRFGVMAILGKERFQTRFLPFFAPLSLISLLYVIIVIFASQARSILDNLGPVFRIFVPLCLYFFLMWTITFVGIWRLSRRYGDANWDYQMAVVQSFTGGSNNFELAIAIAVATYGADSKECLGATIGPLVEVPVLLVLSYVALWLGSRLNWGNDSKGVVGEDVEAGQKKSSVEVTGEKL